MTSPAAATTLPSGLAERLAAAERWLVLTGSGISAESGVPTFRDAQTGLWAHYDAHALATPAAFAADPALVWDWYQWRRGLIAKARPNAGHLAVAELGRLRPGLVLVTQNVDGLHQQAGSEAVIEFHGNIGRNRCFDCGAIAQGAVDLDARPPACAQCGGPLRPDVVWFGEAIPPAALAAAFAAAEPAEVFLAVGTAASVYPAAGLAGAAARALIIEINTSRTPLSASADYRLEGTAGAWLPAIAASVRAAVS